VLAWLGPEPRVLEHTPSRTRTLDEAADAAWRARREALPEGCGAVMEDGPRRQWRAVRLEPGASATGLLTPEAQEALQPVGAWSIVLPVFSYGRPQGLFCLTRDAEAFGAADVGWLHGLLAEVIPWLERADLLEQMQRETAARERERIGRDLHDSAVQPYIGLKYGLEAMARHATPDNPLTPHLSQLLHMTSQELQTLREVVSGLRKGKSTLPDDGFPAALRRQIDRFSALYGLKMHVFAPDASLLRGSAAKAVLMMVNEGLTNVRRHSSAAAVNVMIDVQAERVTIRMRNDRGPADTAAAAPFVPRSLSERAHEVGGTVEIHNEDNFTEIEIAMPLVGVRR
jgi:signal transduction histidine kinase